VLAVDEVMGVKGYTTYVDQASKTAELVVESDSVAIAITETITSQWQGTASELLKLLAVDKPPNDWPATPQGMGGRLVRASPTLRTLDWIVEKLHLVGKKGTRRWSITPPEEYRAESSASSASSDMPSDLHVSADDGADDLPPSDDPHDSADEPTDGTAAGVSAGQRPGWRVSRSGPGLCSVVC